MTTDITAWLSIGSTYTYLTAMRINSVQIQHDLKFHIRPISIREIMKSMDNIPFLHQNRPKLTTCGWIYKEEPNSTRFLSH